MKQWVALDRHGGGRLSDCIASGNAIDTVTMSQRYEYISRGRKRYAAYHVARCPACGEIVRCVPTAKRTS